MEIHNMHTKYVGHICTLNWRHADLAILCQQCQNIATFYCIVLQKSRINGHMGTFFNENKHITWRGLVQTEETQAQTKGLFSSFTNIYY